jgi:hypothetical protein
MSSLDPETQQVAAFEELVGSHGGLGGPQTHPFVLYPTELDRPKDPVIGAASLNVLLKSWIAEGKKGSNGSASIETDGSTSPSMSTTGAKLKTARRLSTLPCC